MADNVVVRQLHPDHEFGAVRLVTIMNEHRRRETATDPLAGRFPRAAILPCCKASQRHAPSLPIMTENHTVALVPVAVQSQT